MAKIFRLCLSVILLIASLPAISQDTTRTSSTGVMMGEGKIYVVMTICLTILIGMIIYLIRLDTKIGKLEKN